MNAVGVRGGSACLVSCGCVDSYDAGAGVVFVDAGKERSYCDASPDDDDVSAHRDAIAEAAVDADAVPDAFHE
jgi:hypothetical protein